MKYMLVLLLVAVTALLGIGIGLFGYIHSKREVTSSEPPSGVKAPIWDKSVDPTTVHSGISPSSISNTPSGQNSNETTNHPISMVGNVQVAYSGFYARATVKVDGKSTDLTPNQLGDFARINVNPGDKISVQLSYPQGHPGDPIMLEVEDGGMLENKKMGSVLKLDPQNNIQFNFQTTNQNGIYRVLARDGNDVKVLNFWAGPEQSISQN